MKLKLVSLNKKASYEGNWLYEKYIAENVV